MPRKGSKMFEESDWQFDASFDGTFESKAYIYRPMSVRNETELFVAKCKSTGLPAVMIFCEKSLFESRVIPETNGLEVTFDIFRSQFSADLPAIVLNIKDRDYLPPLISMLNQFANQLIETRQKYDFANAFLDQLEIWMQFFSKVTKKGLSDQKQRGLYGELMFLKSVLEQTRSTFAIKFWVGPKASIHDFEMGKVAIEVKSTAGLKSRKVSISNERQLDDSGYSDLYLCCIPLAVRNNFPNTLPKLVSEIRDIFSSNRVDATKFEDALVASGYSELHAKYYNEKGYEADEFCYFKVANGFPRIISKDMPNGIGNLKHTLMLASCSTFQVPNTLVEEKISTAINHFKNAG